MKTIFSLVLHVFKFKVWKAKANKLIQLKDIIIINLSLEYYWINVSQLKENYDFISQVKTKMEIFDPKFWLVFSVHRLTAQHLLCNVIIQDVTYVMWDTN